MTRELMFLMTAEQALAFARLVEAAERGDGAAACELGDRHRVGAGGLRHSPKQTFRWYSRSALAGDANGQCNLGACYEHGLGCVQSYVKAVKWYRLSAAQRLGTATMNLGYCTLRGHGVPADKTEALRLFRLAVGEAGDSRRLTECQAARPNARALMYGQVRERSTTAQRAGGEAKATEEVERLTGRELADSGVGPVSGLCVAARVGKLGTQPLVPKDGARPGSAGIDG